MNAAHHLPGLLLALALHLPAAEPAGDPVAPWTKGVRLTPVSAVAGRHTIHSYYVANPESPDGRHVLFFSSKHPAGYVGEVRILERATGKETVLADNVHTEDAHRAACQQWRETHCLPRGRRKEVARGRRGRGDTGEDYRRGRPATRLRPAGG
jgi:hypothetical protein